MSEQSETKQMLDVTIEQVARLEKALFAMRQETRGDPRVLEAIAMTQYQEIQRLRAQIDELIGAPRFDNWELPPRLVVEDVQALDEGASDV